MPPEQASARQILDRRLARRDAGWMDIVTELHHVALITYAVPIERVRPHVHERFEIESFVIDGEARALVSVVPFEDAGFHFQKLPFVRFHFCQTNYRLYVVDRVSGERVAWFFGTTLGSWTAHVARLLWKIPWHRARYQREHCWDAQAGRYSQFRYQVTSSWAPATIELRDTGEPVGAVPGFADPEHMTLCLTHPVEGFYYRRDGKLGSYSVSHEILAITRAEPVALHFGLLAQLGVLRPDEMMRPHSIFVCPRTEFHIYMPPFAAGPERLLDQ